MALTPSEKEDLAKELNSKHKEESYAREQVNIERRVGMVPFYRYCLKQQGELDSQSKDHDRKVNDALKEASMKREEDFAFQLQKMKNEDLRDRKLRQHLRINCPELKELEAQLKVAYTTKAIKAQILEKEARKIREKEQEMQSWQILMDAHIRDEEHWKQMKKEEIVQKEIYKKEIQDQMIFQEKAKRAHYEEFLKEKKLLDELVSRIQEEDHRELQQKYHDIMKTQEDIRAFKEAQELWRQKARQRLEEEDTQIKHYISKKIEEDIRATEERRQKKILKEQMADENAKKIYKERRVKAEKEAIVMELTQAEEREKHEKRYRDSVEKRLRDKLETHAALMAQIKDKGERAKKDQEEDEAYKQSIITKVAEDEKFEQLTNEKRRLKLLQLRKDVEEMIKEKRLQKALDMQTTIKLQEELKQQAEKRRQIIEEERIMILKEHAENLIGFLPRGVFRDGDLEKLGKSVAMKVKCNNL